ncbi:MAG: LpqM protein [Frankiales bacterium]|nr:LpqM protein [Frankiales bacterium]
MTLRRTARPLALVLSLLLAGSLSGCGLLPGDSDGTPRQRFQSALDDVRAAVQKSIDDAVEKAKAQQGADTGDVDRSAPQVSAIRTDTNTAFDYQEFTTTLEGVIASLQQYWATALPQELGTPYSGPKRYVYYRSDAAPGPSCGGEPAPAKNAFYCPAGDFMAWDETGLMIPYYVQAGDFAAAFVLAHEFGHAMQARLPQKTPPGILTELQADCFAGAWSRHVQDQGMLAKGDLDEATLAVFSARDLPGTDFTDPAAHGTGFERTRAFSDGYEGGPKACYPPPAQDWLVGRTAT